MIHPDCHCPRTTHHHGTRTTYVIHKCRCLPCTRANTTANRANSRAKAYGRYDKYVPGDTVRAHMRQLQAQGMGWKTICRNAGVATSTAYAILYGKHLADPSHPEHRPPRIKVERHVAERLLAVELGLAAGAIVPNVATARRLQALVTVGWPCVELGRRLGITQANMGPIVHGTRDVLQSTETAVRALYEELWDQAPPPATATRACRLAARYGWAPPLAWDDDTITDPDAAPDLGDEQPTARRWHIEDAQWLLEAGNSAEQVAARLGVSVAAVGRAFWRAGLDGSPFDAAVNAQNRKAT